MIGFWNRAVYITYFGAFCAVFGLLYGIKTGNMDWAFLGMIVATICDMFDGKIARKIPNRTEHDKDFGVEIDSLADIVAFIVVPAFTIYHLGMNNWWQIILLTIYVICGIIRLGYFNVVMSDKNKAIEYYMGLPVPISIVIFGLVWLLGKSCNFILDKQVFLYTFLVPLTGFLHISKIKIKKWTGTWFYTLACIVAIVSIILGLFIL